jgi:hypothetical protein
MPAASFLVLLMATIIPAFRDFPNEARIIANLLAGYTNLEIDLIHRVQMVREDFDVALKTMFRVRGETPRINIGDALGRAYYGAHGLESQFTRAIGAMRYCLKIRNQYAHCNWWNDLTGKLAFANLEEIAKLDAVQTDLKHLTSHHVDLPLLERQEGYFSHTDSIFTYLNHEGAVSRGQTRQPTLPRASGNRTTVTSHSVTEAARLRPMSASSLD